MRPDSEHRPVRIVCVLTITVTTLLAAAAARYLVAVYRKTPDMYPVVFDRYVFYAAPLFFLAFLVWIERGRPGVSGRTAALIVGVAAALPLVLPYSQLLTGRMWGTNSSTVALVPWGVLRSATGSLLVVYASLFIGGICLGYVFLRSTSGPRLLLFVAANLLVVNLLAQAGNSSISHRMLRLGIGSTHERTWVDAAVPKGATVDVLWSGTRTRGIRGWYPIWQSEIFNGSIRRVYNLHEPMLYALPSRGLMQRGRALYLKSGEALRAKYLLTDIATPVAGKVIASDPSTGMVVRRVNGRVRLR